MNVWLVEYCDYNQSYISLVTTTRELAVSLTKEEHIEEGEWSELNVTEDDNTSFILNRRSNRINSLGRSYMDILTFLIKEHEVKG